MKLPEKINEYLLHTNESLFLAKRYNLLIDYLAEKESEPMSMRDITHPVLEEDEGYSICQQCGADISETGCCKVGIMCADTPQPNKLDILRDRLMNLEFRYGIPEMGKAQRYVEKGRGYWDKKEVLDIIDNL